MAFGNRQVIKAEKGDDIVTAFQQTNNVNEVAEVLKELFKEGKIFLITELTKDEIRLMTRMYMIADVQGLETWKEGLVMYCKLMLSNKRGSRKEILDAIGKYIGGGMEKRRGLGGILDGLRGR